MTVLLKTRLNPTPHQPSVSLFQALKSGSLFAYLILLVLVLIGLALIIVAIAY